jgi:hypothetical protein
MGNKTIKNSSEFVEFIKNQKIYKNETMCSFDVINLFTNIPVELALEIVYLRLKQDLNLKERTQLTPKTIYNLLKLCNESSIFSFNGKYYEQIRGLSMGSNLSPIIAEILMQYFFNKAIQTFSNPPRILRWFVDDSFIIIDKKYLNGFFNHVNNLGCEFENIKFTKEIENQNKITFLDVLISRDSENFKCNVFRKPTHSNRYLNFNSNHPITQKKSVIRALSERAYTHTSEKQEINEELKYIRDVLIANDFPDRVIKSIIAKTDQKFNKTHNQPNNIEKANIRTVVMPYFKNKSEEIQRIIRKYDYRVAYKGSKKLKSVLIKKDTKFENHNNVVYKVNCKDCSAMLYR